MKLNLKPAGISEKLSLAAAAVAAVTLAAFCIYGAMYDYFDTVVFLTLALGIACFGGYALVAKRALQFCNLAGVFCVSFGFGLFFLNSYPVWADRLNNITMYGSRGTLFPVISIMVLCVLTAVLGIASCFIRREADQ